VDDPESTINGSLRRHISFYYSTHRENAAAVPRVERAQFIKKDYLQNIFASAQSCEQQFQNVRLGFWFFYIIYTPCCVSSDEKEKPTAVTTGQVAKCQLTQMARSLQAVVRCTKMCIKCNFLTSEKLRHPAKFWSLGCPIN
jgi:hypothetical protein